MNEEEKKAIEELEEFIKGPCETCKYCEAAYKFNRKNIIQLLNLTKKLQKENEELKSENRRLKVIRYSTEYGTENIHLITKRDLVEINTNKYFIEIQDRKFVDLKQVYLENKKLNEYKENYIPIQKVKDKIEEEKLPLTIVGGRKNKKTLEYGIKLGRRQALQELIEEREEK